jgi:cell division protein ZapA (FtsZ GTPase activity inhibitor)
VLRLWERENTVTLEQLVTIELFGQPYTFKTESEINQAKAVADYLVKEVSKVENRQSSQSPNINQVAILVLAALNIANEHFELKKNHSELLRTISDQSRSLIDQLNEILQ